MVFAAALAAKEPLDWCGTFFGRTQQEAFLHRRQVLERARTPKALAVEATPGTISRDVGQIAVIDSGGGVIGRRNLFNLDRQTVRFSREGSGYRADLSGDTFDGDASSAGVKIDSFEDDDTREFKLPFRFAFFGQTYDRLWVNSNGTLTFNEGDTDYSASYGHFVSGAPAIAPCFADLDPAQESQGVRVLSESGRFVVTWADVPLAGGGFARAQIENFQVRLYPDGRIEFAFRSTNPPEALVGITPGGFREVTLADFASLPPTVFPGGVAETFSAADAVDLMYAAQRFYQSHDDAYDYLVFFNAEGVTAGSGIVAYEVTARSAGEGYGDTPIDIGLDFGSKKRLRATLNMGPLSQYPVNPHGTVAARMPIGDTPVTLLAHEAGHLFLALVSVPDPGGASLPPMLRTDLAHWSFGFNSEASVLGGERIEDTGATAASRFRTTATVEGYSPLDQYLMGLRPKEEVPPSFVVLHSGQSVNRAPQTGITFGGARLDVTVDEIARLFGRRTPDSTVAQRQFRFAFVLIVPPGSDVSSGGPFAGALTQVDGYRREFETFFARASGARGIADATLKRSATLSLAPAAGILENADGTASLEIGAPATSPVVFALRRSTGALLVPSSVTIPAGSTRATFPVYGGRRGVEELAAEPSDTAYETATARVQVASLSDLRVRVVSTEPLVARVEDQNGLWYAGVRVNGVASGADGRVPVDWAAAQSSVSAAVDPLGRAPVVSRVVNGASFEPRLAAGAFTTIFGENLAGARVTVNGTPAPAIYTSDKQVNFLTPAKLAAGPAVVTVEASSGLAAFRVQIETAAPAIFGAYLRGSNTFSVYFTGIPSTSAHVIVFVDSQEATPLSGIRSIAAGLYSVDVQVAPGPHLVTLYLNGIVSNTAAIRAEAGN